MARPQTRFWRKNIQEGEDQLNKPIILSLDDEAQVSDAVDRDLRSQYGRDYRILKSTSPVDALVLLQSIKERNEAVALMVVDQRMPEMEGTDFLVEAIAMFPDARRVLLTAYADTEAAISAITDVGLDQYLMKPWTPATEHLYPVLDDLLADWNASFVQPFEGIRVAGTLWSAGSHHVKDFLARSQIPYRWLDIERDPDAAVEVEQHAGTDHRLPVVFFPDGTWLIAPSIQELAERVGQHTAPDEPFYDVIIIGAGPAGLASAVYGASEGLRTLLIDRETTGGQAGTSSRIENYLGFPNGVSGVDLARRATSQAARLGAEILTAQEVTAIEIGDPDRGVVLSDGRTVRCRSLVIASGVSVRTLDVPGVEQLTGAGVYYGAALTEAANYRGEHVLVVGGANSAGQAAMHFLAVRESGDDVGARRIARQGHVRLPDRSDRRRRQHRGAHRSASVTRERRGPSGVGRGGANGRVWRVPLGCGALRLHRGAATHRLPRRRSRSKRRGLHPDGTRGDRAQG